MNVVGGGHLDLGRRGEAVAGRYLCDSGMVVLSRNWRCRDGELDLVAVDGRCLVVCEVKTRSGTAFGHPAEAVTPAKARRIRGLAAAWRSAHDIGGCATRFDIVSVLWPPGGRPRVAHLRGAF